ncbi:serine carboxypeptidase S28 [Pseudomassariella vexata]|uniref:Serine carboxypeptidase S28 n=1 Tax=Pseudomassariella vexata TaxID=1141098 RepID=A0A1Y2DV18_9PEZI|nr:serine carboxypeptidase S28 [Pseudomassariella vexata]ORY63130.1 serine carboxypeptidase S28 [Pseudomassariella vexata]
MDNDDLDIIGNATFNQNVCHDDVSKGTFEQRFWWDASHYKPGGPVFVFNPGEQSADGMMGYLGNKSLPGYYAQQLGGAAILIEHRYWGKSIPFDSLDAETLQYHTLPNAMKDMTNFALNAELDFCEDGDCNANDVPWVFIGGSYAGALSAWISQKEPGVFAAYHASSAVVEAISDFWTYFSPIEQALPTNCSNDVKAVVSYVDHVFTNGDDDDVLELKTKFNLQNLNAADFADILANPVSEWQSNQSAVLAFCDYIETHAGTSKAVLNNGAGVGLVAALDAYAAYINETVNCGADGSACDTYDEEIQWNDPKDFDSRPWQWMLCNEPFGWWQVGPGVSDGNNIVSNQMRPQHYTRRCPLYFPKTNDYTFGMDEGFTEEHLNQWTKGWDAPYEKVIFVNGELDPWRSATVASDYRPGGYVNDTDSPSFVVEGGVHCPELWIDKTDPYTWPVIESSMKIMKNWLSEWQKPSKA